MLDKIRLWTMQPIEVWEKLNREKVLYVDPALCGEDFRDFYFSYNWMRVQMNKRLKNYRGHYPWWAMYSPKPDLRTSQWTRRCEEVAGNREVRIELLMPREEVLLFGEDGWYWVLCGWYLGINNEDYENWKQKTETLDINFTCYPNLPLPCRHEIHQSWERAFDVSSCSNEDWVQATFEELRLENVVGITEFKLRAMGKRF